MAKLQNFKKLVSILKKEIKKITDKEAAKIKKAAEKKTSKKHNK